MCVCCSYIRAERRVQHVGLHSFEVDVSEDGVLLDLDGTVTETSQSVLGVLGQELTHSREGRDKSDFNSLKQRQLRRRIYSNY